MAGLSVLVDGKLKVHSTPTHSLNSWRGIECTSPIPKSKCTRWGQRLPRAQLPRAQLRFPDANEPQRACARGALKAPAVLLPVREVGAAGAFSTTGVLRGPRGIVGEGVAHGPVERYQPALRVRQSVFIVKTEGGEELKKKCGERGGKVAMRGGRRHIGMKLESGREKKKNPKSLFW